MAKKLVYNYTFDASGQTLVIEGNYTLRQLILITNVTDGAIIYNFADPSAGGSVVYDSLENETTITLEYNTTAMSDSDEIQILVDDAGDTKIEAGESLLDPVHKFRVSNPQNLIDTDFEYGLQSSKWETLELVNNIPSVYARDSAVSIGGISNINTLANSDSVTVVASIPHELSVGDPVEIRGTSSRTADGKYLITAVPSTTTFKYRAGGAQNATTDIKTAYTTVIPGSFFSSSEIKYDINKGIETNGASPSQLTIKTPSIHGLSETTSLYITNSVGKQEFTVTNTSSAAADGDTTIDPTNNTIYIPSHNLYTGQRIYLQPGSGGALPSLEVGAQAPSGESTINTIFQASQTAVNDIVANLKTNNRNGLFWFRSGNSATYAQWNWWWSNYNINIPGYTSSGHAQSMYYTEYDNNSHVHQFDDGSGAQPGNGNIITYYWNSFGEGNNILFTGSPVDLGKYYFLSSGSGPSTLQGHHWYQATSWTDNAYVDNVIDVRQLTIPSGYNFSTVREYNFRYQRRYGTYHYRFYDSSDQSGSSWQTYQNGWQYAWACTRWEPAPWSGTRSWMGYLNMTVTCQNTNWAGYNAQSGIYWWIPTYNSQIALDQRQEAFTGPCYKINFLIPYMGDPLNGGLKPNTFSSTTTTDTIYTYQQVADRVIQEIDTSLSYPVWGNVSGINTVQAVAFNSDRIKLRTNDSLKKEYDFTSSGTGPLEVETETVTGVLDNYYTITGVGTTGFSIDSPATFAPRVLEFTESGVITHDGDYYIRIAGGHGIQNGQKVTFNLVSGATIPGITGGTDYYAIVDDSLHLRLATSVVTAGTRSNAITGAPASSGSYNISVYAINGTVSGIGLVNNSDPQSTVITGESTKFTTTYKVGDIFIVESTGSTVNNYISRAIASVVSDTSIALESPVGVALTDANYYVDTKIHVRSDGEFLHRPFDGGVDITAGKSPDSSIVRQTRKYFRYQSGKGIQCSMAINFNPSRPVRNASGSGSAITMTTEYPHGLVAGNTVTVENAEEHIQYTPSAASYDPTTGLFTITINNHGFLVGEYVFLTEESFTLQCAKDSYATNHLYPRSTDPAGQQRRLRIKSKTTNTITIDVGTSSNTTAHTVTAIASNALTHVDTSNAYNGTYVIDSATDFTFSYTSTGTVVKASPEGYIDYHISGYKNAGIRAGLFDYQNGFFFEYDGKDLHCVRRSSVQQLSGTASVLYGSNIVYGDNTVFTKQIKNKDYIVIRGQSYKVISIESDTEIHIQPSYRGTSNAGVVITRTVDTRVKQSDWNIDKADGSGPSGYVLDINKIQMAYMDYSWYGAGKIRFGFKDTYGHVKYMHEFIHNNRLNEAYMRTGNVPARYEAFNEGIPTFVPSLFHWGTSVIMDGGFDDDDSYLFTASGNTLTFTNGDADTANASGSSSLVSSGFGRFRNYYVAIPFNSADASKFSTGIGLWTQDGQLNGDPVAYTSFSGSSFFVYIFVSSGYSSPASYPSVTGGTTVNIGAPTVGSSDVDLNSNIPLISVRLSPSADNNLIGELGERDIINRMQLKLQELGISVSHDANISVILNGSLSNIDYENVGSPSLTQYVAHEAGDTVNGGTVIYSFRASGGTEDAGGKRFVASNAFDLSQLIDLGNSILGGNGVYPDGPDIVTVACNVINTAEIDSTSSFQVASRISWTESQA